MLIVQTLGSSLSWNLLNAIKRPHWPDLSFFACNTDTFSSQQLSRRRPHLDEVNFSVIFTTAINIHDASLTLLDPAYFGPIKPREGGGVDLSLIFSLFF